MEQKKISITETPNELTNDIDIGSDVEILRILRQADTQIFAGWRHYPGLRDEEIINKMEKCVAKTAAVLKSTDGKVAISGAGTSGRLAMLVSRKFNKLLAEYGHEPRFKFIMAGTNKALIKAQEGAEDDPIQAIADLEATVSCTAPLAFYGVTCGFSAPYIAGQLDYSLKKDNIFPCLLGFNPIELSRNVPIENWDKTFIQVASELAKSEKSVILNPVVGPEPITGSTRMKGGSATKLLLELIFSLACVESGKIPAEAYAITELKKQIPLRDKILAIIDAFEDAKKEAYLVGKPLADMITKSGQTLRNDGHIYYLGEAPIAILGLIDASECPPTFGADFSDVRGFVDGGWDVLLGEGNDISHVSYEYRIGIKDFKKDIMPKITSKDLVIGLAYKKIKPAIAALMKKASEKGATVRAIMLNPAKANSEFIKYPINLSLKNPSIIRNDLSLIEYSLKLMLNSITTAAHIIDGKIYQNRMIDLRISNNKLFFRSIGILSKIAGVSEEVAREAIIKSLFESDTLSSEMSNLPISQYVKIATPKNKVIPRALLLSTGRFTIKEADNTIAAEPRVRNIIEQIKNLK